MFAGGGTRYVGRKVKEFLRKLQTLRSSGSAHRKGSNYRKIAAEFGVNSINLRSVFLGILRKALSVLDFLVSVARSGQLTFVKDEIGQ